MYSTACVFATYLQLVRVLQECCIQMEALEAGVDVLSDVLNLPIDQVGRV